MYNIKTINSIAKEGIDTFDREKYAVAAAVTNPDAILVRSQNLHEYAFEDNLLCIARAGAGTNNIPVDKCADHGIAVFNTPGANSDAVKELAIASLLLASRDILGGIEYVKTLAGNPDAAKLVEAEKNKFVGPEIKGKTLGVIGLGAVGAKLANDAIHLGMRVLGYDPYLSVDAAWQLSRGVSKAADTGFIYRESDYISIHVPYMESTHHLINRDTIAQMKDGVRILNLSRAELVCDEDILAALKSKKVSIYVTDFPNSLTAGAEGVIAIPHLGASTPESEAKCAVMAALSIQEYLENGNIQFSVNMPRVTMPRVPGMPRISIYHRNIPNMISQFSNIISEKHINIENMASAGVKGHDFAYTIMDLSSADEKTVSDIADLDGVVRARLLT